MSQHRNCVATRWYDRRAPVCAKEATRTTSMPTRRMSSVAIDFLKFSIATEIVWPRVVVMRQILGVIFVLFLFFIIFYFFKNSAYEQCS